MSTCADCKNLKSMTGEGGLPEIWCPVMEWEGIEDISELQKENDCERFEYR